MEARRETKPVCLFVNILRIFFEQKNKNISKRKTQRSSATPHPLQTPQASGASLPSPPDVTCNSLLLIIYFLFLYICKRNWDFGKTLPLEKIKG